MKADLIAIALLTGYGLTGVALGWTLHRTADHSRWRLEAWWHRGRATLAEARADTAERHRQTAEAQRDISRRVYLDHLARCPLTQHATDTQHGDAA